MNAEYEKRLNAIKAEIRKMDHLLERQYRMWGSDKIPAKFLQMERFKDGGYSYLVKDLKSGLFIHLFVYYGFYYNQEDQTVQIFKENELRIS